MEEVITVEKPWGREVIWAKSTKYVGKILFIRAGKRLSKQYHERKEETIRVNSGIMKLTIGSGYDITMKCGDVYHIKPGVIHRMTAITDCELTEVSTPELEDVVRIEDDFGRVEKLV